MKKKCTNSLIFVCTKLWREYWNHLHGSLILQYDPGGITIWGRGPHINFSFAFITYVCGPTSRKGIFVFWNKIQVIQLRINSSKQECIPVGCVPPAAVAVPRGSLPGTPHPKEQSPPEQAPPGTRHPPKQTPPEQAPPPPVDRITDACENITLPQLRCGR